MRAVNRNDPRTRDRHPERSEGSRWVDVDHSVIPDGERIALKRRKFKAARMQPSFAGGFASGSYRMVFIRDFHGHVDTLRVSTGRTHNLKFNRLD